MASADAIIRGYRTGLRSAFVTSTKNTRELAKRHPQLPIYKGGIRASIKLEVGSTLGNVLNATYTSDARSDKGFPYGAYIDEVPKISANKAKYLNFFYRGAWHSPKEIAPNKHHRWWTEKLWGDGTLWFDQFNRAFKGN